MNYPNQNQTTGAGGTGLAKLDCVPAPPSEIQRESAQLDQEIQRAFDASQELSKRLQPILSQYPSPPPDQNKNPEEAMCDLGSTLRRSRRSVESVSATLTEILSRLAI